MKHLPFKKISLAVIFATVAQGYALDAFTNSPVREKEQAKTSDLYAQFLYFSTSESLDFAYVENGNANHFNHDYKILKFDSAPGYRVGVGYNLSYDRLDTQFSYTWFQSFASARQKGQITSLSLASRLSLLEPFNSIKVSSKLSYNIFDGDLGRYFYLSKRLQIRPFVGIKGGWINQNLHLEYEKDFIIEIAGKEKFANDFAGVGPKGGALLKFVFGQSMHNYFSLFGSLEAGFLWGRWKATDRFIDSLNTKIDFITSPRNFGALVFHSMFGFSWDYNFNKNSKHLSMQIGYEIQDWLNYLQIFTNISGGMNSDLILQGLNLGLRVDF